MARQITCECGQIVRGETDDELVGLTLEHLRSDHPQLADRITRDEIVALVEVVEERGSPRARPAASPSSSHGAPRHAAIVLRVARRGAPGAAGGASLSRFPAR